MTTDRKFCRFNKQVETITFGMPEVPEGGLCLSAFLVITDTEKTNSVLMGHLNPKAPWDHIGALDLSRVDVHSKGWMLPSSHLMVYESPQAAAKRILREQLEIDYPVLEGPQVVSETYTPRRFPNLPRHWDIEFIFKGEISKDRIPKPYAWSNLSFVDLDSAKKSEIARSNEDILESAGLVFKQS
jgi:ADP-ribose pyrophosphatase YjhB (NUDIX family)